VTCNAWTHRPWPVLCKRHFRCPECGNNRRKNVYEKDPENEQILWTAAGRVRCGACGAEFDGETFTRDRYREAKRDGCLVCVEHPEDQIFLCGKIKVDLCTVNGCNCAADFLCDHPVGSGKTCDLPLCRDHAQRVGPDYHLCPIHLAEFRGAGAARVSTIPSLRIAEPA